MSPVTHCLAERSAHLRTDLSNNLSRNLNRQLTSGDLLSECRPEHCSGSESALVANGHLRVWHIKRDSCFPLIAHEYDVLRSQLVTSRQIRDHSRCLCGRLSPVAVERVVPRARAEHLRHRGQCAFQKASLTSQSWHSVPQS